MRNLLFFLAVSVLVLPSCSTSDQVVGNGFFQKRKYNKGFHVNLKRKVERTKSAKVQKEVFIRGTINSPEVQAISAPVVSSEKLRNTVQNKQALPGKLYEQINNLPIIQQLSTRPVESEEERSGPRRLEGFSLAAFILGLFGIFPLAIAFGIIGINRVSKYREEYWGEGFAIAGLALGSLLLLILSIAWSIALFAAVV
jgi:hypothetical protein